MAEKLCQLKKKGGGSGESFPIYAYFIDKSNSKYFIFDKDNNVIDSVSVSNQQVTLPDGTIISNTNSGMDTAITPPSGKTIYVKTIYSSMVGQYGTTKDPDGAYTNDSWNCHLGSSYPIIAVMIASF